MEDEPLGRYHDLHLLWQNHIKEDKSAWGGIVRDRNELEVEIYKICDKWSDTVNELIKDGKVKLCGYSFTL